MASQVGFDTLCDTVRLRTGSSKGVYIVSNNIIELFFEDTAERFQGSDQFPESLVSERDFEMISYRSYEDLQSRSFPGQNAPSVVHRISLKLFKDRFLNHDYLLLRLSD